MPKKIYNKIEKSFDKYILNQVNKKFPHSRKHKYSDKYCLLMFKEMLNDVVKWKSLTKLSEYKGESEYHYKYLNTVFNKWSKNGIFKDAYTEMLNNEYYKLKHIKNSKTIKLFIDCSFIYNMYGIDCKATNPEYRKKKCTKISVIADEQNNIISIDYDKTHLSAKGNPSFCHDLKLVQTNLNNMFVKMQRNKITKLCGDKGYISRKRFKLNNNKRVKLITPKRKNQVIQNTRMELKVLKGRQSIERSLSFIKKYNRVVVRKDKCIENYMGFVFLALMDSFYKKNIK